MTTMLTDLDLTNPLTAQAAVFAALAQLAELHPDLPGAYITISHITPTEAYVLLDSPADVEAWRLATHTDTDDVHLTDRKGDKKLHFTAPLGRVTLKVFTVFVPACVAVAA
ncbi:hypothetical protein OOK31_29715 [Streptomyces sp. NBC_00249]|uniref:hypothetical protein n=1 Tax=Streptomyces sp. NBC_00249 TaxID=2975690 RepID=UPI00224F83CB|nr:hypothetical protein [Streptomyces sp. NBC_00249]MCX5198022.1 hypothetical protein [Streptomyces sp. NBC_00249]